jgi:tRNA (cytosine38-C5)-methyltransferase
VVSTSAICFVYTFFPAVRTLNDRPRYYCGVAVLHVNQSSTVPGEGSSLQHYLQQEQDINADPQIWNSIPKFNVAEVSTASDIHIVKQISNFLDNTNDTTVLLVPENILKNDSAWCFDIVYHNNHWSSCFTHSYGRYIQGTGSIL